MPAWCALLRAVGLLDRFLRSWRPELGTSGTGRVRRCPTCAEQRPADAFTKQAAALDNFNRTIAQQSRVKSAVWAEHVRYWSAKRAAHVAMCDRCWDA